MMIFEVAAVSSNSEDDPDMVMAASSGYSRLQRARETSDILILRSKGPHVLSQTQSRFGQLNNA